MAIQHIELLGIWLAHCKLRFSLISMYFSVQKCSSDVKMLTTPNGILAFSYIKISSEAIPSDLNPEFEVNLFLIL